jgi:hypothetical protein
LIAGSTAATGHAENRQAKNDERRAYSGETNRHVFTLAEIAGKTEDYHH